MCTTRLLLFVVASNTSSFPSQDWDKPEYIPDPDAKKPEDWDDDTDGEWEPPNVPNPAYKVSISG